VTKRRGPQFDLSVQAKSQHQAFVKTARELGCFEDEAAFDQTLKKIASEPRPKSVEKRKTF
jgi:hypothetical protein